MSTHLRGTLDVAALMATAPSVADFETTPLELHDVDVFQAIYEIDCAAIEDVLPPALHPSVPAHAVSLVLRVGDSELGSFSLAHTRVAARAAVAPRGFSLATYVSRSDVGEELARRWGYRCIDGEVLLDKSYDRATARVSAGGRTVLAMDLVLPENIPTSAVRYLPTMNLASTPRGPLLLQAEATYEPTSLSRGTLEILAFDGTAWGDGRVVPTYPVSATLGSASATLEPLRYFCHPEELAEISGGAIVDLSLGG